MVMLIAPVWMEQFDGLMAKACLVSFALNQFHVSLPDSSSQE